MKKNLLALLAASILFVILLGSAVIFQSAHFLYAASAVPIVIVIFIPDIKTNQYIRPGKRKKKAMLCKTGGGDEPELLTIAFQPGYLRWNRRTLFFSMKDVQDEAGEPDELTATFPVLKFDLLPHRFRKKWIGIRLANLKERSASLSYTVDEVNRLVIRMEDIRELTAAPASTPASINKNIEA